MGVESTAAPARPLAPGAEQDALLHSITDCGASGWITVSGTGKINDVEIQTPTLIRFGELTQDEVFISRAAAVEGYTVENTGAEPLVGLRYFGPDVFESVPNVGDHRTQKR